MADDDIEARLAAAAEAAREREIVGRRSADLRARVGQVEGEVAALRRRLRSEERDVKHLEGLTLAGVLARLLGTRDDRLARERAEADAAALRFREASGRLDALRREQAAVDARWAALAGAGDAYAAVLADKERHLRATGDPRVPRLMELADGQGRCRSEQRELAEALQAAVQAHGALAEVGRLLGRADAWSTWDLLGGGLITSAMKHGEVDAAADAARRADLSLQVLRTELLDVGGTAVAPHLAVDGLTRFVDVWFDNVFTDFSVARRIDRAYANVKACQGRLDVVRTQLDHAATTVRRRLDAIEGERRALLTDPSSGEAHAVQSDAGG